MARAWAYAFYHSKPWELCRAAYGKSKHWLCERCHRPGNTVHHKTNLTPENINDPNVTMGWWNLELLCEDCHNQEHHRTIKATRPGFAFDDEGNLIEA